MRSLRTLTSSGGHLRSAQPAGTSSRFSVSWTDAGHGFVAFASPSCGTPAGGALVRATSEIFIDLPMPPHGYVGQIRVADPDHGALPL